MPLKVQEGKKQQATEKLERILVNEIEEQVSERCGIPGEGDAKSDCSIDF